MSGQKKSVQQQAARSWKLLKYNQTSGFEEIESPFQWNEHESVETWMGRADFNTSEEVDGRLDHSREYMGITHHYNDKSGARLTMINGPCRFEFILTLNAADHLALRIALAPLAQVILAGDIADAQTDHGSLKEWRKYEEDLERRHPRHSRTS